MLLAFVLLALAVQARAGTGWSALWRNADQRGEALLEQGDAKDAAKEFVDPRHKSYAEFKAGSYAAAARDLSALDDGEAYYNRGNALAYAGDLKGALKAYDAAIKRDPHNQDARHNRDLVAKALKQKQEQKKKDADKNSQKNDKKDDKKDGKQSDKKNDKKDGKQSDKKNDKKDGKKSDKKNDKKDGKQSDKKNDKKDDKQSDKKDGNQGSQGPSESSPQKSPQTGQANAGAAGKNKPGTQSPQDKAQAAGQSGSHDKQQDQKKKPGDTPNEAEQARRDAEASMKGLRQGQAGDDKNGHNAQTASAPLTEKQISQNQWLRSIPDDPGGLLRRKFLIEHMMRH